MSQKMRQLFRIGPFTLDLRDRSLFQGGQRVRLTPKAFDLLCLLVEHRGGLVTREEIVQALWPDTFVEDSNLTYQMSTLRKALEAGGGEALIETVPKRGYRLTVRVVAESATADESSRQWHPRWVVVTLAIAAVATGAGFWLSRGSPVTVASPRVSPLTTYPGSELDPSLSPDGSQVAFIWNGGSGAEFQVYTQAVGASAPRRLSSGAMNHASPVWSPDGRCIAFLRQLSASRSAIIDGRYLIFVRRTTYGASQLFGISLTSDLQASGHPSLISSEPAVNASPRWTPQNEILFLVGPALVPELRLWRTSPASRPRKYRF